MIVTDVDVVVAETLTNPESSTVAISVSDDVQVTASVRSRVLLLARFPVAVSCTFDPRATVGVAGVMEIVLSVSAATTRLALSDSPLDEALIVTTVPLPVPAERAVTRPDALTVAIELSDEDHVAELVTSVDEPPTLTAEALYCCVSSTANSFDAGVTVRWSI